MCAKDLRAAMISEWDAMEGANSPNDGGVLRQHPDTLRWPLRQPYRASQSAHYAPGPLSTERSEITKCEFCCDERISTEIIGTGKSATRTL